MRKGTPRLGSVARTLAVLDVVIADGGQSNTTKLARHLGMPIATVHRHIATLVAEGYLKPGAYGQHLAGARLLRLVDRLDEKRLVANAAAVPLHQVATQLHAIAQLGTLENEMVTYRIKTGQSADNLFTRVDMQLEAYCSGIGKVLLANLPDLERKAYLATGPFVPLTANTIIDPTELDQALEEVRTKGFAIDKGEIAAGLICVAVPIRKLDGSVPAAISVSQSDGPSMIPVEDVLSHLIKVQKQIEVAAFG
jgi:DNA-binding IclR family transcriptional regulator